MRSSPPRPLLPQVIRTDFVHPALFKASLQAHGLFPFLYDIFQAARATMPLAKSSIRTIAASLPSGMRGKSRVLCQ